MIHPEFPNRKSQLYVSGKLAFWNFQLFGYDKRTHTLEEFKLVKIMCENISSQAIWDWSTLCLFFLFCFSSYISRNPQKSQRPLMPLDESPGPLMLLGPLMPLDWPLVLLMLLMPLVPLMLPDGHSLMALRFCLWCHHGYHDCSGHWCY